MQVNDYNKKLARKILLAYCKVCKVKYRDVPKLVFNKKEYPVTVRLSKKTYASFVYPDNVIYVSLRRNCCKLQLIDSIVHEIVHKITDSKLEHGPAFNESVSRIVTAIPSSRFGL